MNICYAMLQGKFFSCCGRDYFQIWVGLHYHQGPFLKSCNSVILWFYDSMTRAEHKGTITSLFLDTLPLLMKPEITLTFSASISHCGLQSALKPPNSQIQTRASWLYALISYSLFDKMFILYCSSLSLNNFSLISAGQTHLMRTPKECYLKILQVYCTDDLRTQSFISIWKCSYH